MQKHFAYVRALPFGEGIRKYLTVVKTKREETWTETSEKVGSGPGSCVSATAKWKLGQGKKSLFTSSQSCGRPLDSVKWQSSLNLYARVDNWEEISHDAQLSKKNVRQYNSFMGTVWISGWFAKDMTLLELHTACPTAVILNLIGQFRLHLWKGGGLNGNWVRFSFVVSSMVEKMGSAGAPAEHKVGRTLLLKISPGAQLPSLHA